MAAAAAGASCSGAGNNGGSGAGGMEVDAAVLPTVMASGVTGSVSVALHPLVILNISDHWIRMRSQEGRPVQVIGALIGRQEGRNIEVMNSFELLAHAVEENVVIDKEYYYTKEEQFKQVFKDMEFLGWYTTGGPPDQSDIHVHKQVCEIIESPLFLKLNPMTKHTDVSTPAPPNSRIQRGLPGKPAPRSHVWLEGVCPPCPGSFGCIWNCPSLPVSKQRSGVCGCVCVRDEAPWTPHLPVPLKQTVSLQLAKGVT
ncbi:COP9 signalosome complex subunit 6-like [Pangshura tecta]